MATPSDEVPYQSPGLIVYTENGRLIAEFRKFKNLTNVVNHEE